MASHSSILAWRIPWMEEPGRLQSMKLQRVGHNWATSLHFISNFFFFCLAIIIDSSLFNVNFQINIKSTKILWDLDCGCNELADKFKENFFYWYRKCGICLYLFIHWCFYLTSNILHIWGFPDASAVKNLHEMQETWVWSLRWDDPLEEELATHSSILAWKIPRAEQPGEIESME